MQTQNFFRSKKLEKNAPNFLGGFDSPFWWFASFPASPLTIFTVFTRDSMVLSRASISGHIEVSDPPCSNPQVSDPPPWFRSRSQKSGWGVVLVGSRSGGGSREAFRASGAGKFWVFKGSLLPKQSNFRAPAARKNHVQGRYERENRAAGAKKILSFHHC